MNKKIILGILLVVAFLSCSFVPSVNMSQNNYVIPQQSTTVSVKFHVEFNGTNVPNSPVSVCLTSNSSLVTTVGLGVSPCNRNNHYTNSNGNTVYNLQSSQLYNYTVWADICINYNCYFSALAGQFVSPPISFENQTIYVDFPVP